MIRIFKALGDPTRYRIIHVLMKQGEVACRDLGKMFSLSAPALSHHFRVLQECGLMQVRKEGAYHFFRLDRRLLDRAMAEWERGGGARG
jgi:ArsR family transcriptional regulator